MIPLRDRNPSGVFPTVTTALILVNTFVFLYEIHLGPAIGGFLKHYALIPAVVTGSDTEKSMDKGKDTSGKYIWTDVFVKQNGKWRAVSSQNTKVPK